LNDILNKMTYTQLEEELTIENYKVENYCSEVERIQDEDGDFERPVIVNEITIHTTQDGKKVQILVQGRTALSDLETMGIEETTFNISVY
ncbi:hypothetical protein KAU11_07935, partial [Candidatus Babeliales bacterium]|nr:hypothetical protein [Candidatus Babeliales bacterium]